MSVDLIDFRGKITAATDAWLETESRITGKERQQVAREALHEIAVLRIHAATVLLRQCAAKGVGGEPQGGAGSANP